MILLDLLRTKGQTVISVRADDSVAVAAQTMIDNHVGSAVVYDEAGKVVGLLSERDLVHGLARRGANLDAVAVRDLMTTNVVHCQPHDDVNAAMGLMTNRRVRHLPVFEGERLVGIISIGDLVKNRIDEIEDEARHLRDYISA
ncbi:MAG: CBS domain-containing protein [Thiotrichales bacterium]